MQPQFDPPVLRNRNEAASTAGLIACRAVWPPVVLLAVVLISSVVLSGCGDGGTPPAPPPRQPKPSAKPPVAQTRLEQLEKENASLNQRVQNLGAQIKQVRGENEAMKRENQSLRRTISQNKWRIRSLGIADRTSSRASAGRSWRDVLRQAPDRCRRASHDRMPKMPLETGTRNGPLSKP